MTAERNTHKTARWSFYSAVTFIVLLSLLHVLKPETDPSWNFISEYQVGRFGWLMSLAFLSLASSSLFLSVALWWEINLAGKIGILMLILSATGMLIAAVFPTDPLNTSPELVTRSGKLHQVGAMLDQVPFAALLITVALFGKEDWRSRRRMLVMLLLLVWFGFIYFVASIKIHFPADGKFGPLVLVGWQNRMMIVTQAFWLALIARYTAGNRKYTEIYGKTTANK